MTSIGTAYHCDYSKRHGRTKWGKEEMEPVMVDVRAKILSRADIAAKHGFKTQGMLSRKIIAYNLGELK